MRGKGKIGLLILIVVLFACVPFVLNPETSYAVSHLLHAINLHQGYNWKGVSEAIAAAKALVDYRKIRIRSRAGKVKLKKTDQSGIA